MTRNRRAAAVLLLLTPLVTTCTTTSPTTNAAFDLESGERVVILFSHHAWLTDNSKATISRCLADGLRRAHPGVEIVPDEVFARVAFPDLDPRGAPREPEHVRLLLEHPTFMERIAPLHLRYLISVSGEDEHRIGFLAAAPVAAAGTYQEKTALSAVVVDVSGRRGVERVAASAESVKVFGVVGIVPIVWWGSASDTVACGKLSEQLRTLLMTPRETLR